MLPLPDGSSLATIRGRILKRNPDASSFRDVFRIPRGSRPMNICLLPDGNLYWGEYFFNYRRQAVHVYGSTDAGESWRIVHTFPPGAVRHVHGIVYDPYQQGLWIFTGDSDRESKIMFTPDQFRTIKVVFEGSQQIRAASMIPLPEGVLVPTDTPQEQNYIRWLDPSRNILEQIAPVPGSVFYGNTIGDWIVLSVCPENSPINAGRHALLLVSKDGRRWSELYVQQKDFWHGPSWLPFVRLPFFQHPVFIPTPGSSRGPILYAYGQALANDDDCLLVWNLDEEAMVKNDE